MFTKFISSLFSALFIITSKTAYKPERQPFSETWSIEKAQAWYSKQGWLIGCNYIPSTSVNVLEMWQNETFEQTIQTSLIELQYAQSIGFNSIRVFLHYLLWLEDSNGFIQRIDRFINLVAKYKMKIIFVLFDDCWHGYPKLGPQKEPIPGVHNSRWVQCPGQKEVTDTSLYPIFKNYIQSILKYYKSDSRILMWDLYNEPGNGFHGLESVTLLYNVFLWAKEINFTQPVTSALWKFTNDYAKIYELQLNYSDIITFHKYGNLLDLKNTINWIENRVYKRPIICTEYMARTLDSRFETHLPYMKSKYIGALNWGLVSGKTQTIYPWWSLPYFPPPKIWFHDIFYKNGSAFNQTEILIIKNLTLFSNS